MLINILNKRNLSGDMKLNQSLKYKSVRNKRFKKEILNSIELNKLSYGIQDSIIQNRKFKTIKKDVDIRESILEKRNEDLRNLLDLTSTDEQALKFARILNKKSVTDAIIHKEGNAANLNSFEIIEHLHVDKLQRRKEIEKIKQMSVNVQNSIYWFTREMAKKLAGRYYTRISYFSKEILFLFQSVKHHILKQHMFKSKFYLNRFPFRFNKFNKKFTIFTRLNKNTRFVQKPESEEFLFNLYRDYRVHPFHEKVYLFLRLSELKQMLKKKHKQQRLIKNKIENKEEFKSNKAFREEDLYLNTYFYENKKFIRFRYRFIASNIFSLYKSKQKLTRRKFFLFRRSLNYKKRFLSQELFEKRLKFVRYLEYKRRQERKNLKKFLQNNPSKIKWPKWRRRRNRISKKSYRKKYLRSINLSFKLNNKKLYLKKKMLKLEPTASMLKKINEVMHKYICLNRMFRQYKFKNFKVFSEFSSGDKISNHFLKTQLISTNINLILKTAYNFILFKANYEQNFNTLIANFSENNSTIMKIFESLSQNFLLVSKLLQQFQLIKVPGYLRNFYINEERFLKIKKSFFDLLFKLLKRKMSFRKQGHRDNSSKKIDNINFLINDIFSNRLQFSLDSAVSSSSSVNLENFNKRVSTLTKVLLKKTNSKKLLTFNLSTRTSFVYQLRIHEKYSGMFANLFEKGSKLRSKFFRKRNLRIVELKKKLIGPINLNLIFFDALLKLRQNHILHLTKLRKKSIWVPVKEVDYSLKFQPFFSWFIFKINSQTKSSEEVLVLLEKELFNIFNYSSDFFKISRRYQNLGYLNRKNRHFRWLLPISNKYYM